MMKMQDPSNDFRKPQARVGSAWSGILLTFLLSLAFSSSALAQDASPPQIVIPENEFRSEPVEQGQGIDHTFKVLNKGGEPLRIIKVKPG